MTAQKYDKNWTYAGNFGQSRRNREALRNSLRDTAACKLLTNHTTSVNLWKNADYQYRLWWIFRKKHTVQRDFLLTGCVDADKILTVSPPPEDAKKPWASFLDYLEGDSRRSQVTKAEFDSSQHGSNE